MLRLKRLYLRNFMSIGEVDIDFSNPGIIGITGFNNKGGASNGSGKTAIISGLVWTMFGRTPNGNRTKDVLQWGKGTLSGIVEFEQESTTYRIVRTQDTLDFLINGEQVKGLRKDIQEVINQALKTNYELFRTFNVFMKDWQWFITEVGDADKKKLFKSILNLKKLDTALEHAKTILQSLKSTASSLEGEIKQIEQSIPELERNYSKTVQAEYEEEQRRKLSISQLEERKEQLLLLKQAEEDNTVRINAIREQILSYPIDNIRQRISEISKEIYDIEDKLMFNTHNMNSLKDRLDQFNAIGNECPTCGQKMSPQARASNRKYMEVLINEYMETIKELTSQKEKYTKELHEFSSQLETVDALEKEKVQLEIEDKRRAENREHIDVNIDIINKAIEELKTPIDNIKLLVASAKAALDNAKTTLQSKRELLTSTLKEIDIYSYMTWLYSRQGVITTIVQKCFDRLKYLANKYLIHICSEGFKIEISPFKQLKSGELQEEIDIYILDHGRRIPYTSLSSGQQQRINIALLIALFTWGREIGANQFDLMLLDEVLDLSLDYKGQEDTIAFIKSLRHLIYHIILISHKETTADIFDRQIHIIRDNVGISSVTSS